MRVTQQSSKIVSASRRNQQAGSLCSPEGRRAWERRISLRMATGVWPLKNPRRRFTNGERCLPVMMIAG
jgi:hypothetical protein